MTDISAPRSGADQEEQLLEQREVALRRGTAHARVAGDPGGGEQARNSGCGQTEERGKLTELLGVPDEVPYVALQRHRDVLLEPAPPPAWVAARKCLGITARDKRLSDRGAAGRCIYELRDSTGEEVVDEGLAAAEQLSPREGPERYPLRPAHERLGDAEGCPDVCRAGEHEHPGWSVAASACAINPCLDRGRRARSLLELVDAQRQRRVLDESGRVIICRFARAVVIEGHVARSTLLGHH